MNKIFISSAVLALCLAFVAGQDCPVTTTSCGGVATFLEMRVPGCCNQTCNVSPGNPLSCSTVLIPAAAAPALRLKVTVTYFGFPVGIIDTVIANSGVQPGIQITLTFVITPNDILRGQCVPISSEISNNQSGGVLICRTVNVCVV